MKVTVDYLLLLVREHGAEKALRYIDVEEIEDHTAKVIARTVQHSGQTLEQFLIDMICARDATSTKPE